MYGGSAPPGADLTFQHILLHLNLVELVGANDDAVASEVDTAAGLRRLDLLKEKWWWQEEMPARF